MGNCVHHWGWYEMYLKVACFIRFVEWFSLNYTIGLKLILWSFIQSEIKPTRSCSPGFSHASHQLHAFFWIFIGSLDCLSSLGLAWETTLGLERGKLSMYVGLCHLTSSRFSLTCSFKHNISICSDITTVPFGMESPSSRLHDSLSGNPFCNVTLFIQLIC